MSGPPHMMRSQAGFSLMEVMSATAGAGVVVLAASAFLIKGFGWMDELRARIEINRHARETYDLLAFGGQSATVGKDGTKNIYSLRGFKDAPPNGLRTPTNALKYTSNKVTITADTLGTMTITCTGVGLPVPDCKDNHSTQSVGGWMGSDVKLDAGPPSINGLTVEVSFSITNPFEAQRATSPGQFTDSYAVIFTTNREEDDPR